jgi:hypothetical protein
MSDIAGAFAPTYAAARERFRAAATARDATLAEHVHPRARGPAGEPLAIDVARLGQGGAAGGCFLHNSKYDFNDDVIPLGGAYLAALAERALAVPA